VQHSWFLSRKSWDQFFWGLLSRLMFYMVFSCRSRDILGQYLRLGTVASSSSITIHHSLNIILFSVLQSELLIKSWTKPWIRSKIRMKNYYNFKYEYFPNMFFMILLSLLVWFVCWYRSYCWHSWQYTCLSLALSLLPNLGNLHKSHAYSQM
jgi:hypothetical protein